jgi:hypothetical protein
LRFFLHLFFQGLSESPEALRLRLLPFLVAIQHGGALFLLPAGFRRYEGDLLIRPVNRFNANLNGLSRLNGLVRGLKLPVTGADEDIDRLSDACFGITAADEVGYAIAQSLVLEIGGEPFGVREDARTLYHAALAHGSNHIVTVVADSLTALRAALQGQELLGQETVGDAPGGLAERIIGPLARAALENTLHRGQAALTGPVARGDAAAVAAHLDALNAVDPQLAQAYCADSLRTAQRAHAPEEVLDVLADWSRSRGPHR